MNIRGPRGATGAQGLPGDAGKDGRTIENRGKWATNTEYDVDDMVTSPYLKSQTGLTEPAVTGHFVCIVDHTSTASDVINTNKTFAGNVKQYEKGLNKTKWELRRTTVNVAITI